MTLSNHWKNFLSLLLPILFKWCTEGNVHYRWEQVCECGDSPLGYDYEMQNCFNKEVEKGDWVQPTNLRLNPPLAWKVVGFERVRKNPRYKIVIEHPISGDQLTLENLPHNTIPAEEEPDPEYIKNRKAAYEAGYRPAAAPPPTCT